MAQMDHNFRLHGSIAIKPLISSLKIYVENLNQFTLKMSNYLKKIYRHGDMLHHMMHLIMAMQFQKTRAFALNPKIQIVRQKVLTMLLIVILMHQSIYHILISWVGMKNFLHYMKDLIPKMKFIEHMQMFIPDQRFLFMELQDSKLIFD